MVLNTETKQKLEQLLAKPSSATQADIPVLQQLIKTFPYYQPLHLLLAKASSESQNKQTAFTKAALYTGGGILHRIIHEPQHLAIVEDLNLINYQAWSNVAFEIAKSETTEEVEKSEQPASFFEDAPEVETIAPATNETTAFKATAAIEITEQEDQTPNLRSVVAEAPEIENLEPLAHEIIAVATEEDIEASKEEQIENIPYAAPTIADAPEIENLEPLAHELIKVCEPIVKEAFESQNTALEADEQETFEEITELIAPTEEILVKPIEPFIEPEAQEVAFNDVVVAAENEATEIEEKNEIKNEEKVNEVDTEEELEIESVASIDFFAFDRSFAAETISEEETETVADKTVEEPVIHTNATQENIVSKYDDDQLPFTFLWWLAKTRKDHEQIFRPFASPVKANAQPLQQQYVEHIFHLQAPLDLGEVAQASSTVPVTKGNEIIENFIKNDPQIKALKPEQINNENKAKRSAEDSNDVVSETLAQIYIEQMLYHKAIDTYQKLSLKFPEKSGYFADLIQSLEKKI